MSDNDIAMQLVTSLAILGSVPDHSADKRTYQNSTVCEFGLETLGMICTLCINSIKLNMNDASRHHNPEILLNLLLLEAFFPHNNIFMLTSALSQSLLQTTQNHASILLIAPGGRIPLTDPSPAECWRHSTSTPGKLGGLLALSTGSFSYSLADPLKQKRGSTATVTATGTIVSGTATPTGNSTISNGTTPYNGTFPGPPIPFTGGTGATRGCGAVVLAGLLVGSMVVVL